MATADGDAAPTVRVDRGDHDIVTVTLQNPRRKNAISGSMFGELSTAFRAIANDPSVRVVVIAGDGDDFCSGADLSPAGDPMRTSARLHSVHVMRNLGDAAIALRQVPQPVIARVRGVCVGAGLSLALGADLVYASDNARFGAVFARRGLSVDFGASWLLPRAVGMAKAKELALLADIVAAAEAERLGLVTRVVADAELDAHVATVAGRLAAGPPIALSLTKRMLDQAYDVSFAQAIEVESMAQSVNAATRDTSEAIRAFLEKRDATFEGR
jgi:enoyl-CoA hydratase/carnithine racemase